MSEIIIFKITAILISLPIFFIALLSKRICGTWFNPSSIFSLLWSFYTIFPLIMAFEVPISVFPIIYILAFVLCFSISISWFDWKYAFYQNLKKPSSYNVFNTQLFRSSFYIASAISIAFITIGVLQQGFSVSDILDDPLSIGGSYSGKRYGEEIKLTAASRIGLYSSYLVVIAGGMLYGSTNNKKKGLYVLALAFFPALCTVFLQGAKGLLVISVFFFLGSLVVSNIYDKKYMFLLRRSLVTIVISSFVILSFLVVSFISRGGMGMDVLELTHHIRSMLISYSSGHLYAFSDWFSHRYNFDSIYSYDQQSLTLGFYTLMSFFRLFGDDRVIPNGIYQEYFMYSDYLKTNIYTSFRGLITDFTLLGSLVLAIILGFLCNFCFYRLLCRKFNAFYILFYIFFCAISYQSFIASSLTWNTFPIIFIFLILTLSIYFRIHLKSY